MVRSWRRFAVYPGWARVPRTVMFPAHAVMALGGRLASGAIFMCFISQLLNDKIRLGPGLDSCIPVFDIRKFCQWDRWWCPA